MTGWASPQFREAAGDKQLFALTIDRDVPQALPIEITEHELVEQA